MTKLAFVDTETTGLNPERHEIWEVALVLREDHAPETDARTSTTTEHVWQLDVDLGRADLIALNVGHFQERRASREALTYTPHFLEDFIDLTWGAHLVGAVPSFDAERLERLARRHGFCPGWHYHLVDVEAVAAGALGFRPPWKSEELSGSLGVAVPSGEDRHTALGDARWARDLYDTAIRWHS